MKSTSNIFLFHTFGKAFLGLFLRMNYNDKYVHFYLLLDENRKNL